MSTLWGVCSSCHAHFQGKQNHCKLCHQTFATEAGGDSHRVGPFDPSRSRRCMLPGELSAGGMWPDPNASGTPVWHGVWSKSGRSQRRPAGDRGAR